MKRSIIPAFAIVAATCLSAAPAFAGFIATSDNVVTSGGGSTVSGTFTGYTADTLNDPQISGGDLSSYHYTITLLTSVPSGTGTYDTGTYEIFYQNASVPAPGVQVSAGTVGGYGNTASFNGDLAQTPGTGGPGNPAFADFSVVYGTNSSALGLSITNGRLAIVQLAPALSGTPAPEPASLGVLALGGAAVVARRRRSV